ncbi:hypothetical protein BAUCODRAFT_396759 [Baudoinia panamericana UAMH 10762]|uniref:Zn(2)-C6 fungal-type domain-containing protein n=1 Tax=Baudoinia panamericana (strain UAMH 10762) TaxID=717646 RepID=M2NJD9_BAUPA|nr:uncharacterized protein BAUCODRAFT_396759 [Baudoinia panamericana UAMH 10762]EMC99260.1 hypothetical protein BAUCODRAFT_396759 [Baudoinia panamericana UAMH 10762]
MSTMSKTTDRTTVSAKACSTCHSRKVRCDIGVVGPICSNCSKAGAECIPHVRKRKRDLDLIHESQHKQQPPPTDHRHVKRISADHPIEISPQSSYLVRVEQQPQTDGRPAKRVSIEPPIGISPQSSYLGRAEYVPAHIPIDEEDASRYHNIHHTPSSAHEDGKRTVELPQSIRQSLVSSFVAHCRPWMPLMAEAEIWRLMAEEPDGLLMTAIYVAGSRTSTSPRASEVGAECYRRAKWLFYAETEVDPIRNIMAVIFLQWWNGSGPEHVSTNNSSFWLRIGVALAHQTGLHKEPSKDDRSLRRRIWWTLVSRDSQIATSHGRPRAINLLDSDVRPLTPTDFDSASDADRFIPFVQITLLLGDLTERSLRGDLTAHARVQLEERLLRWLADLPPTLQLFDRETRVLRAYNFASRNLHLAYFATLTILFHQKQKQNPSADVPPTMPSLVAASFILGIVEEYLNWGDTAFVSPACIFYLFTASLALLSSHRFPCLASAADAAQERGVVETTLEELKKRFASAYGKERVVKAITQLSLQQQSQGGGSGIVTQPRIDVLKLSPRELEFFAPFGAGLCRHWGIVQASKSGGPVGSDGVMGGRGEYLPGGEPAMRSVQPFPESATLLGLDELLADDAFGQYWWNSLTY